MKQMFPSEVYLLQISNNPNVIPENRLHWIRFLCGDPDAQKLHPGATMKDAMFMLTMLAVVERRYKHREYKLHAINEALKTSFGPPTPRQTAWVTAERCPHAARSAKGRC